MIGPAQTSAINVLSRNRRVSIRPFGNFPETKGAPAKARFRQLVASGKAHGAVAYHDGAPVGWISYERRRDLPRLDRAPSLACDDAERVWSIPCFFIARGYRRRGLATVLLKHALRALRARGAQIAEGYPVRPRSVRTEMPPLFAFTGTVSMFARAGFMSVGAKTSGKQRMRKRLRGTRLALIQLDTRSR